MSLIPNEQFPVRSGVQNPEQRDEAERLSAGDGNTSPALPFAPPLPPSFPAKENTPLSEAESPPLTHYDTDPELAGWINSIGVSDCGELDPGIMPANFVDDCHEHDTVPLQVQTSCITGHAAKGKVQCGELWKQATTFKFSVAAKLRSLSRHEDADTLEECHSRLVYAQCAGCSGVKVFRNRCDNFFCPECQPSLSKRRAAGVAWWTQQINQPKHVVLTVRNIPDLTKGHVLELKKWFTRLRHRKFCRGWRGGFYSVEVTNENRGWHIHLHALVDARWIDARMLATEWNAANNGHGYIVKVKDCRGADYLKEVTKYAAKGSQIAGWSAAEIATFIDAFRGTKTFGVFGSLYGKRTEFKEWIQSLGDGKARCECGCNKASYYSEFEWAERNLIPATNSHTKPPPKDLQQEFGEVKRATDAFFAHRA